MTETVQPLVHPERDAIRLEAVLAALADPIRLYIVRELARVGPCSCSSIELPVSKSTGTHHWRVLREAGVTRVVPRGTSRMTSLRRDDLDALFPGLLDGVLAAKQ